MEKIYPYKYRPEYGSSNLLIEFSIDHDDAEFLPCLINAITEINPIIDSLHDLWMNDEIMIELKSNTGEFTFSKDVWGFVFITCSPENQPCLKRIDKILNTQTRFQKLETNFDDYKKIK